MAPVKNQTYVGRSIEPALVVTCKAKKLDAASYKVTFENNVDVGQARFTVRGTGDYKGKPRGPPGR